MIDLFRKRRGIHIPYNKQGLIYFTCVNVKDMPQEVQQKILNLCIEVGKEDYKALYEVVTNDKKSVLSISLEYFINEKRLYKLRKEFYEKW
ncbi:MAG: hypothetical protein IJ423_05615 [Clostridia bacterium]|nr:hypothetical protein [Clostridia bacterium]MBQ8637448.1 hypothetical protein [Clostridia bacterium]